MAMSERQKMELRRQQNLKEKLDEIAAYRARVRRALAEPSSPMHTPKWALKELRERSRKGK